MATHSLAPRWVAFWIVVFFPIGVYLLWNHADLRFKKGWWVMCVAWVVVLSALGSIVK